MSEGGENSGPYGGAPGMREDAAAPFRREGRQGSNPVLEFAMSRFNSETDAINWYRTQKPMPGYGDKTPEELVREGSGDDLLQVIKAVEAGEIGW